MNSEEAKTLVELAVGLEPTASPLPRECSTPELRERGTERTIAVQHEIRAAPRVPCEYSTGFTSCQSETRASWKQGLEC